MSDSYDVRNDSYLISADQFPQIPKAIAEEIIEALFNSYEGVRKVVDVRDKALPPATIKHNALAVWCSLRESTLAVMADNTIRHKEDLVPLLVSEAAKALNEEVARINAIYDAAKDKDQAISRRTESLNKAIAFRAETLINLEAFASKLGVSLQMREAVKSLPAITHNQATYERH